MMKVKTINLMLNRIKYFVRCRRNEVKRLKFSHYMLTHPHPFPTCVGRGQRGGSLNEVKHLSSFSFFSTYCRQNFTFNIKYSIFILLVILASIGNAQQKWFSKFGWWGVDIGNDVCESLDGHFMVTGYTGSFTFGNSDILLSKVNGNAGWEMWTKHFGGTNNDIGKAIISTADSGFVITGYTNSYGTGGYDGFLLKVNKNGDSIWMKTYGDTNWDILNALQPTSDGGFVMTGYSYSKSKGGKDFWIVKTDSLGNLQWEKKLGGANDDEFVSVEILHDNRIACFGTTYSFSDIKGNYCIFKTNNNGDSLFFKEIGYANLTDIGYDFFERKIDSAFVICGTSQSPFGSDTTYYHQLVVDSIGNWIFDLKQTNKNLKYQTVTTGAHLNNYRRFVVYDLTGYGQGKREPGFYVFANQWFEQSVTYGSSEDDFILSCKRTKDNGLIAVGYTFGFNAQQEDVFIVKLDSTGQLASNVVNVENFENNYQLKIYPNIASDKVFIELPDLSNTSKVFIQDIQGRMIIQKKLSHHLESVDISNIQDGLYFVTVINNSQKYTGKLVKKSIRN